MNREQILESVVFPAMEEIGGNLDNPTLLEKTKTVVLFGSDGLLDSLALVSLVVSIEERIASLTKKNVRLVSDQAMSRSKSPFRNPDTLSEYIEELLQAASS